MSNSSVYVVGSELAFDQTPPALTGIPRVVVQTHTALLDGFQQSPFKLVPASTRARGLGLARQAHESLIDDPINHLPIRELADVDLLLILGLNMRTDFVHVLNERRRRRLPVISLLYDTLVLQHPEWFLDHGRTHFRTYLQQLLRVSDHIIVPTATVRGHLIDLGWQFKGELHVLPLGTSFTQQQSTHLPHTPLRLMYVSTVAPYKGHDLLIDTFDELREIEIPTELHIVGRQGWNADLIASRILSHPEFDRTLHWEQRADDERVMELARTSHIAVIPTEAEGFGLFLEEALSMGLKVVARDLPVLRERSYPNLTFAPGNPLAMKDAILHAHELPHASLSDYPVRTMSSFTKDLRSLITRELP